MRGGAGMGAGPGRRRGRALGEDLRVEGADPGEVGTALACSRGGGSPGFCKPLELI